MCFNASRENPFVEFCNERNTDCRGFAPGTNGPCRAPYFLGPTSATEREQHSITFRQSYIARPPHAQASHQQSPSTSSHDSEEPLFIKKMGSRTAPHFPTLLCRLESGADCARVFGRRAPQERCVQLWFSSKPGGVMLPPEPDELTLLIYSCQGLSASEEMEKCNGGVKARSTNREVT